mgnify:CR=1 FL=1
MTEQHYAPQDQMDQCQQLWEDYRRLTPENRKRFRAYLETLKAAPDSPAASPDSAQ